MGVVARTAIASVVAMAMLGCQNTSHEALRVAIKASGGGLVDRVDVTPRNFLDDPKLRVFLAGDSAARGGCSIRLRNRLTSSRGSRRSRPVVGGAEQ
jgi:hypothetical protein